MTQQGTQEKTPWWRGNLLCMDRLFATPTRFWIVAAVSGCLVITSAVIGLAAQASDLGAGGMAGWGAYFTLGSLSLRLYAGSRARWATTLAFAWVGMASCVIWWAVGDSHFPKLPLRADPHPFLSLFLIVYGTPGYAIALLVLLSHPFRART